MFSGLIPHKTSHFMREEHKENLLVRLVNGLKLQKLYVEEITLHKVTQSTKKKLM